MGGAGLFVFRAEPSNTTAETTKNRAHTTCFFLRDEGNSNGQNTMDRIWVFFVSLLFTFTTDTQKPVVTGPMAISCQRKSKTAV